MPKSTIMAVTYRTILFSLLMAMLMADLLEHAWTSFHTGDNVGNIS